MMNKSLCSFPFTTPTFIVIPDIVSRCHKNVRLPNWIVSFCHLLTHRMWFISLAAFCKHQNNSVNAKMVDSLQSSFSDNKLFSCRAILSVFIINRASWNRLNNVKVNGWHEVSSFSVNTHTKQMLVADRPTSGVELVYDGRHCYRHRNKMVQTLFGCCRCFFLLSLSLSLSHNARRVFSK